MSIESKSNCQILSLIRQHSRSFFLKRKFDLNQIKNNALFDTYEFAIARTDQEFTEAYRLVYESYCAKKLAAPNSHQLYFNAFHFLPTTITIILRHKVNHEVIATMSVINDSPLGLPLEEIEDISAIRKIGRVVEGSSLSIKESMRSLQGKILIPMIQFSYQVARELCGADYAVFAFNPKAKDFYELMLSSKTISKTVKSYSKANDAPAISMASPCSIDLLSQVWSNHLYPSISREMSRYLATPSHNDSISQLQGGEFYSDYLSLLPTTSLKKYFEIFKEIHPQFSEKDQIKLKNIFFSQNHAQIFQPKKLSRLSFRTEHRLLSKCNGQILNKGRQNSFYTLDVSESGLRWVSSSDHPIDAHLILALQIGPKAWTMLQTKILWKDGNGQYGATIENVGSQDWKEFINHLTKMVETETQITTTEEQAA